MKTDDGADPTFAVSSEIESMLQLAWLGRSKATRVGWSSTAMISELAGSASMNGVPLQPEKFPMRPAADIVVMVVKAVPAEVKSRFCSMSLVRPGPLGVWQFLQFWK